MADYAGMSEKPQSTSSSTAVDHRRTLRQPQLTTGDLHWLPIQHRIEYKVAVLTFKSCSSATAPTYLSRHIKARVSERTLRSSTAPLLDKPFTRTDFANRAFRTDRLELIA